MNPYTQGMPEELVEAEQEPRKGSLSPTQRDRLEDLIRNMTPERLKVLGKLLTVPIIVCDMIVSVREFSS